VIAAEEEEVIHEAAAELADVGGAVVPVQANLGTPGGVEDLYQRIRKTSQPVTALALNAGTGVSRRHIALPPG
jgi:uncharacterized protein